jgi:hypothetical protein
MIHLVGVGGEAEPGCAKAGEEIGFQPSCTLRPVREAACVPRKGGEMTVWSIWRWEFSPRLRLRALRLQRRNSCRLVTPPKPKLLQLRQLRPNIDDERKHSRHLSPLD